MSILRQIIESKCEYDKTIPYTYEARVPMTEVGDSYSSYFADTIHGLLEYLNQRSVKPTEAQLFEVYISHESAIDKRFCTTANGEWLFKSAKYVNPGEPQ